MASLVLGVAGAAIGSAIGGTWGARIGYALGSSLGASMTKLPDIESPRLNDLRVMSSTYGAPIPVIYGTNRIAGNIIWATKIKETKHSEDVGGKGAPSQEVNSYTYSVSMAVGVCEGEISGISRIWANGKVIYDARSSNASATGASANIRFYNGSETQTADALIVANEGSAPAYLGLAYVVFEDFQLAEYGNAIPNFEFEAVQDGTLTVASADKAGAGGVCGVQLLNGLIVVGAADNTTHANPRIEVWEPVTKTKLVTMALPAAAGDWRFGQACFVSATNEVWFGNNSTTRTVEFVAFDAINYLISRYGSSTIASPYDHGAMLYVPTSQRIWYGWGATNATNKIALVSLTTMGRETDLGGSILDVQKLIYIDDLDLVFASCNDGIKVFSGLSEGLIAEYSYSVSGARPICYDADNRRVIMPISGASGKFVTIDVDSLIATEHSLATLYGGANIVWDSTNSQIITSDDSDIFTYNGTTFAYIDTHVGGLGSILYQNADMWLVDRWVVGVGHQATASIARVPRDPLIAANTVALSAIVADISQRSGLSAADYDVTQLTDAVKGFTVGRPMSGRAAIEALMTAYLFDATESTS